MEEVLDLSFDRLLMMMMMMNTLKITQVTSGFIKAHLTTKPATAFSLSAVDEPKHVALLAILLFLRQFDQGSSLFPSIKRRNLQQFLKE